MDEKFCLVVECAKYSGIAVISWIIFIFAMSKLKYLSHKQNISLYWLSNIWNRNSWSSSVSSPYPVRLLTDRNGTFSFPFSDVRLRWQEHAALMTISGLRSMNVICGDVTTRWQWRPVMTGGRWTASWHTKGLTVLRYIPLAQGCSICPVKTSGVSQRESLSRSLSDGWYWKPKGRSWLLRRHQHRGSIGGQRYIFIKMIIEIA